MKISVSTSHTIDEIVQYPCLQIDKEFEMIVLFKEPYKGTIIHSTDHNEIGRYDDNFEMEGFEMYVGNIQLTN